MGQSLSARARVHAPRRRNQRPEDYDRVKVELSGRWQSVLLDLYPNLAPAFRNPGTSRMECPIHGSTKGVKADGFRVFKDVHTSGGGVCNSCGSFGTGIDLIAFLEQCTPSEALSILERKLGIDPDGRIHKPITTPRVKIVPKTADPDEVGKRSALLANIWNGATPLHRLEPTHHAIRYLAETRGLGDPDVASVQSEIRFHPALYYRDADDETSKGRRLPGLVSLFRDAEHRRIAIHRTYLDPDAPVLASVPKAKKVLKRLDVTLNGSIALAGWEPVGLHANLCEGVETGLSIVRAIGRPVFAATTATLVANWRPPKGVKRVTIWADRDKVSEKTGTAAGQKSSVELAARLAEERLQVRIVMPHGSIRPGMPCDWNDVLLDHGPEVLRSTYSCG